MSANYRLPRRLWILGRLVSVVQVTPEGMKDALGDDEGAVAAWDVETHTIYVLRTLAPVKKSRAFWHEVQHALVDLMDDEEVPHGRGKTTA